MSVHLLNVLAPVFIWFTFQSYGAAYPVEWPDSQAFVPNLPYLYWLAYYPYHTNTQRSIHHPLRTQWGHSLSLVLVRQVPHLIQMMRQAHYYLRPGLMPPGPLVQHLLYL